MSRNPSFRFRTILRMFSIGMCSLIYRHRYQNHTLTLSHVLVLTYRYSHPIQALLQACAPIQRHTITLTYTLITCACVILIHHAFILSHALFGTYPSPARPPVHMERLWWPTVAMAKAKLRARVQYD